VCLRVDALVAEGARLNCVRRTIPSRCGAARSRARTGGGSSTPPSARAWGSAISTPTGSATARPATQVRPLHKHPSNNLSMLGSSARGDGAACRGGCQASRASGRSAPRGTRGSMRRSTTRWRTRRMRRAPTRVPATSSQGNAPATPRSGSLAVSGLVDTLQAVPTSGEDEGERG
jgi:hypothetical protein